MNDKIDNSFLPRRRAQIFQELHEKNPIIAVEWLINNVPIDERKEITKYFNDKETEQHEPEPTTD
jgi:hypothetical protein